MSTRLGLLSLFTILVPCGQLFAADLPVTAPIKAVTVFPDRAEVTRVVDVSLPAGATTLVIDNLPASLFPESVRVSGEGGQDVRSASCRPKSSTCRTAAMPRRTASPRCRCSSISSPPSAATCRRPPTRKSTAAAWIPPNGRLPGPP